jgi:hypothetical protein
MRTFKEEWRNFFCALFWPRFITSAVLAVGLYIGATTAPSGQVQLLLYALAVFAGSLAGGEFHKRYICEKSPLEIQNAYSARLITVLRNYSSKGKRVDDALLRLVQDTLLEKN